MKQGIGNEFGVRSSGRLLITPNSFPDHVRIWCTAELKKDTLGAGDTVGAVTIGP